MPRSPARPGPGPPPPRPFGPMGIGPRERRRPAIKFSFRVHAASLLVLTLAWVAGLPRGAVGTTPPTCLSDAYSRAVMQDWLNLKVT